MNCKVCGHKQHRGPCYPNCKECTDEPKKPKIRNDSGSDVARPLDEVHEEAGQPKVEESDQAGKSLTQVERNRRWREKNPDRHKKYQRDYMRGKRLRKADDE